MNLNDRIYGRDHHQKDNPWEGAPPWVIEIGAMMLVLTMEASMATQAQLDKLKADIGALVTAAAAEITAAIAAAQNASDDPAIDTLDNTVTGTTKQLTDAAAALQLPPAAPAA